MKPLPFALRKYLHRINPRIEYAVEVLATEAEASLHTQADWNAATQNPAASFDTFADGTVTLKESDTSAIQSTTGNAWIESLSPGDPQDSCTSPSGPPGCLVPACFATWTIARAYGRATRLRKFRAYVTRNRPATGADFNGAFRLDLFTIGWYGPHPPLKFKFFIGDAADVKMHRDVAALVPIADPVYMNAITAAEGTLVAPEWPEWELGTGVDEGLITFDLTGQLVTIGGLDVPRVEGDVTLINGFYFSGRTVLARITAVRGSNPDKAAWRVDNTIQQVATTEGQLFQSQQRTIAARDLSGGGRIMARAGEDLWFVPKPDGTEPDDRFHGVPRCEFVVAQYPAGTSTIKAQVDLGSVPASAGAVEFGAIFQAPEGTTCTPEVSPDDISYTPFVDGDTAADLSLAAQQTYWLRYSMVANTKRDTSPTGFELAVRERSRTDISPLVRLTGGDYAVDPRIMRTEIRQVTLDVIRDGVRDFRDRASRLAYEHHPNDLDVEISIRAATDPAPARDQWLLIDKFRVAEPESLWGAERLSCVSVLERLKIDIPRLQETSPGSGVFIRPPIQFAADTATDVWTELMSQATVAVRYQGQPPGTSLEDPIDGSAFATALTKDIVDRTEAKKEIDHIGLIMGGCAATRAGRISWFDLFGRKGVKVVFHEEDIVLGGTPRGFAERMIRFTVPYGWDDEGEDFTAEVATFDADALTNLGFATVGRRDGTIDDEAAKYLPNGQHARAVGFRNTKAFASGVLYPWEFISIIPHPELELGDMVALVTDRLTLRDPINNREIKGRQYVKAIVAGSNPLGTRFTVWVREFADIIGFGREEGDIGELIGEPEILSDIVVEEPGTQGIRLRHKLTVDIETAYVLAFRRKGTGTCPGTTGWPTQDGTQTATVDYNYFKIRLDSTNGWELVGEGFATGDTIREIFIPVGFDDRQGTRLETCYAIQAVLTPAITSGWREHVAIGTDCGANQRQVRLHWTVNSGVVDGTHDMKIYRRTDGGAWELAGTVTTPATTLSFLDTQTGMFFKKPGKVIELDYRIDLINQTTQAVLDQRFFNEIPTYTGVRCIT